MPIRKRIAIDLGTANTLVWTAEDGIVTNEPTVVAVSAPSGHMLVDIGGGAAEAAVISLGEDVIHKSVRVAGNKIDEEIQGYLKKKNNLIVGDQTAEDIKIKIGSATK